MSIGASIISSKMNKAIPRDTIFLWEISLTGRIKNCFQIEKRIKEAQKLWFKKIYVPDVQLDIPKDVEIIKVKDIAELVSKIV
jgi:DNA repair protein RadA/Sms